MSFDVDPRRAKATPFIAMWIALLVLSGGSVGIAFLKIGVWALLAHFVIAALQAAILFVFFMRLKGPPSLKWVFAAAGFFWLIFLFGLSATDYASRASWPIQQGAKSQNADGTPR